MPEGRAFRKRGLWAVAEFELFRCTMPVRGENDMTTTWLVAHQPAIAIVLAVIALLWQFAQFIITHTNDAKSRQFEAYHRLIRELVQPESGATYVDRQCAAVFELVRFRGYRPLTIRILEGIRNDWKATIHPRLAKEFDLALSRLKAE